MSAPAAWQLPEQATFAQFNGLLTHLDGVGLFDAGRLQRFDTSALALLIEARRRAQRSALPFRVINAPTRLRDLARLYGVEELLFSDGTI